MREEEVVLEHDADVAVLGGQADVGRRVLDRPAVDDDAALFERDEPGQGPQQGGLARAVGPDHRDDRLGDLQVDVEVQARRG